MNRHVGRLRRETRGLVASLDFHGFAAGASDLFSGNSVPESFRILAALFPRLRCIRLDGHGDFDPFALARQPEVSLDAADFELPVFLSVAGCQTRLPDAFFASPYLEGLVYLDISAPRARSSPPWLMASSCPSTCPASGC